MSQGGGAEEEESMHTFCIKTKAHCSLWPGMAYRISIIPKIWGSYASEFLFTPAR